MTTVAIVVSSMTFHANNPRRLAYGSSQTSLLALPRPLKQQDSLNQLNHAENVFQLPIQLITTSNIDSRHVNPASQIACTVRSSQSLGR